MNKLIYIYEAVCLACGKDTRNDVGFLHEQGAPCASCGSIDRRYPQNKGRD